MNRIQWLGVLSLSGVLAMASVADAQTRPYIGFVYPAGGQQGTTFRVKLGGQGLDGVDSVLVTGEGVSAKVVEYWRKMGPQDMTLLREQVQDLKRDSKKTGNPKKAGLASVISPNNSSGAMMMDPNSMMGSPTAEGKTSAAGTDDATGRLIANLEKRMHEYVNRPACTSIASLIYLDVTVAPNAKPGPRELRLASLRGVSNPLVFHVGQLPEICRKPMVTADFQVLGKEELAQRKRPADEVEQRIPVPGTANGQIASGEVNAYRFEARKGQRLVISVQARQLIPFVADAVPGWFQPVLAVYDAGGKEVAYNDDYRFNPDPTAFFEARQDGQYIFTITDAIYRGREDFVYRATIGELPLVTSIFPLGARAGQKESPRIDMKGWNLQTARLSLPARDAEPGIHLLTACNSAGIVSNRVPFALDTLPETFDKEPNNDPAHAQKVTLPVIINGRINRTDDWDVFEIAGRAGEEIVAEVSARRLDSPLDSILKITDSSGKLLGLNDDHEDLGAGTNTHHADSYLMVKLPADGRYYVHLGDAARHGGEEYAYRLRISAPRPDFALRLAPSSIAIRSKSSSNVNVYVIRKDGFTGAIKLGLKNPPAGISSSPATVSGPRPVASLGIRSDLKDMQESVSLTVVGSAKIGDREVVHEAVPTEDKMQAFLWRHLVPAEDFKAVVYNPSYTPPPKRVPPARPPVAETKPAGTPVAEIKPAAAPVAGTKPGGASTDPAAPKPKFTKSQVVGRLRQLKLLYEDGLLTDAFYDRKVSECEAAQ